MTWILILTITSYSYSNVAVDHITGFKTSTECERAGDIYISKIPSNMKVQALCISQNK